MNKYDVAGLLKTYSEKCTKATSKEKLQDIIRELKRELNSEEIRKFSFKNIINLNQEE